METTRNATLLPTRFHSLNVQKISWFTPPCVRGIGPLPSSTHILLRRWLCGNKPSIWRKQSVRNYFSELTNAWWELLERIMITIILTDRNKFLCPYVTQGTYVE